jgi:dipeptidyl aminopeptidase/acylaminoacyl peptidase
MRRTILLLAAAALAYAQKRPFDADAMMELKRIGDPQISPDGRQVAFTVQTVDVPGNRKPKQIWVVDTNGGGPRQITQDGNNERARTETPERRAN